MEHQFSPIGLNFPYAKGTSYIYIQHSDTYNEGYAYIPDTPWMIKTPEEIKTYILGILIEYAKTQKKEPLNPNTHIRN